MKFILATLLTALLSFIAGLYLPWWSIALIAFLTALFIRQSSGRSFLAAFLGIFLLWGALSWWQDVKNSNVLSAKVAGLFHLGTSSFLLILITAFIGALVAGFAALSGASLRPHKVKKRY